MADAMTFPNTWEEYEKMYGLTDTEQIYTNGSRLIPSFRVKQWLEHLESEHKQADTPQTDCETCRYGQDKHRYAHICNECGVGINNYTPQTDCGWGEPNE